MHVVRFYGLRPLGTASLFMHFVHRAQLRCLCTSCTEHSFAVYTLRVLSMRGAYLCAAHTLRTLCTYGLRPRHP